MQSFYRYNPPCEFDNFVKSITDKSVMTPKLWTEYFFDEIQRLSNLLGELNY